MTDTINRHDAKLTLSALNTLAFWTNDDLWRLLRCSFSPKLNMGEEAWRYAERVTGGKCVSTPESAIMPSLATLGVGDRLFASHGQSELHAVAKVLFLWAEAGAARAGEPARPSGSILSRDRHARSGYTPSAGELLADYASRNGTWTICPSPDHVPTEEASRKPFSTSHHWSNAELPMTAQEIADCVGAWEAGKAAGDQQFKKTPPRRRPVRMTLMEQMANQMAAMASLLDDATSDGDADDAIGLAKTLIDQARTRVAARKDRTPK